MNAPLPSAIASVAEATPADSAFADAAIALLAQYTAAFDTLDADTVAALYAHPAAIAHGERCTRRPTTPGHAAVRANMTALCAQDRARGLQRAQAVLLDAMPQGAACGYVDVQWTLHRTAPQDAADYAANYAANCATHCAADRFRTGYLLHRIDGRWQIRVCTAYEETL